MNFARLSFSCGLSLREAAAQDFFGGRLMVFSIRQFALAIIFFCCGAFATQFATEPSARVIADDKKSPEAFLSGGARSEKVLTEILVTLRQVDSRIANIEDAVKQSSEKSTKSGNDAQ